MEGFTGSCPICQGDLLEYLRVSKPYPQGFHEVNVWSSSPLIIHYLVQSSTVHMVSHTISVLKIPSSSYHSYQKATQSQLRYHHALPIS